MSHRDDIPRRHFLQSAASCLGLGLVDLPASSLWQAPDLEKAFAEIRSNLLEMINEERAVAKVRPVAFDGFATQIANKHAVEMATDGFASHWSRDGLKPYHRYSFAGGTDATQENVSAADNTWSLKPADLKQDTAYLHVRLYQEQPPNDGHRKTILAPHHTHVGFGLAVEKLRLRMVELFVARYVEVKPVKRNATPGETVSFSAKIESSNYSLNYIEVYFEPLPTTPELGWLREARSYALPGESIMLLPKLTPPLAYKDRTVGVVDVFPDGRLTVPIKLFKNTPGIYTIAVWIKRRGSNEAFPATEVCVRAE
jgi:uncharacterized protein YkwD